MAIGAWVPAGLPAAQEETSMSERGNAWERDVLLAAKLHVPRPPPGFVARPRLAGRLDEGLSRRLILVCAPAGSGKTALLAAWASGGPWPVAWLVLDDYHLIGAGQVHASVQFLLGYLPPGLHLVLAARSDPPLRLSRLRARG